MNETFSQFGLSGVVIVFALSALGSAMGIGAAGMAVIGAWKKCYLQNKPAPFSLFAFAAAPISQTIYGFLLMGRLAEVMKTADPWIIFGVGLTGGLAIGASAYAQGRAGAAGADSFAETGKGLVNYFLILGTIESVALFVYVFFFIFNYS